MEKKIENYPDYNKSLIKGITIDNLILCDLYGSRKIEQVKEDGTKVLVTMPLADENVSVANGKFFTLTDEELEELKNPTDINNL